MKTYDFGPTMRSLTLTTLLFLCCRTKQSIEVPLPSMDHPLISLSLETDLGDMTSTVPISNGGELPMGLHPITIAADGFEDNFSLFHDVETIACPEELDEKYHHSETDMDELNNTEEDCFKP